LRQLGIEIGPQPECRPAVNMETLESNVPGVYLAGVVVAGNRTGEIFIENGRFHGGQIAADIKKKLGGSARKILVITEGLLVYLTGDEVSALGRDLAAQTSFRDWAIDLCSPGLLKMLQKNLGALSEAGSPLKFGPEEGPGFFIPSGWKAAEVYSMLKTAARIKRLPFFLRLMSLLPESNGRQGSRPWGAVCRLTRM